MHVTESRAIASRCPKLRTSKGHLVYKRPPARSQLRSRKPILRHACYNHTRSTHVQYEQQVSSHKSTSTLYRLTHIAYKDHKDVTNITSYNGSKLGLSTDKFNKWLREALYNKHARPRRNQAADWDYTSLVLFSSSFFELQVEDTFGDRWVHLKRKLSKREYKVVLSKTYVGTILLMHMYQGKGGGVQQAEAPALTWLVLNYEYQTLR